MYSKQSVRVNFFVDEKATHGDKVHYGRISESLNTGKTDKDNAPIYEYESWSVRFVGKSLERARELPDKARITLTEWAARNPYDKEKKRNNPYLMVMDFEMTEDKSEDNKAK